MGTVTTLPRGVQCELSSSQPKSQRSYGEEHRQHGPVKPAGAEFVEHIDFALKASRTHGQVDVAAELQRFGHQHSRAGRVRAPLLASSEPAYHLALARPEHVVSVSQQ